MNSRRLFLLALAATATMLSTLATPGWAASAKRTTTTQPPAPGLAPGDESGRVVNSWAVAPAGSLDPRQPGDRAFLSYAAVPGQDIKDAVVLFNFSNVPLTFRLYATDAFNDVEGAFDVLAGSKKPKEVGAWIRLDQEMITLAAKKQATVPVTVHVPAGAAPGDHAGAVLASSPAVGTSPDGKVITVDRRTGTRVYIRVAGPLHPELAITKVHTTYRPSLNPFSGRNDVSYRIENLGNVRLAGKRRASVSGVLGLGRKRDKYAAVPELLPGQSATVKASFKGLPATFLNFATAKLEPNSADTTKPRTLSRGAATVAVPWAVLALALIAYLVRYSRRAYRRHGDEQSRADRRGSPNPG
jgi:hypothetical protein